MNFIIHYFSVTDKFKFKKYNCTDWELEKLIDIKRQEYANNRDEVSHIKISQKILYKQ